MDWLENIEYGSFSSHFNKENKGKEKQREEGKQGKGKTGKTRERKTKEGRKNKGRKENKVSRLAVRPSDPAIYKKTPRRDSSFFFVYCKFKFYVRQSFLIL